MRDPEEKAVHSDQYAPTADRVSTFVTEDHTESLTSSESEPP